VNPRLSRPAVLGAVVQPAAAQPGLPQGGVKRHVSFIPSGSCAASDTGPILRKGA
jgi:hypothetical protein